MTDHIAIGCMHETTVSFLQCPCFYMFSGGALSLLKQFLKEKQVGLHVSMAT